MNTSDRKFRRVKSERVLLSLIEQHHGSGYIKRGTFSTEIIWNKKSFVFPASTSKDYKEFKSGLFLFGCVRADALAYLKKHPNPRLPKKERSVVYNQSVPRTSRKICGTDLNHAYWRIAYNMGIISRKTYEKGLPSGFKSTRLAALSTLGAGKKYNKIVNGQPTKEVELIGADENLAKLYKIIRFTCFKYMTRVMKMLGDDFLAYKTDAIYYYDTPKNRKMVREYFAKNELLFKQLV